jgi:hypothetical protein
MNLLKLKEVLVAMEVVESNISILLRSNDDAYHLHLFTLHIFSPHLWGNPLNTK